MMNLIKRHTGNVLAAIAMAGILAAPISATAQSQAEINRRAQKKNEWKNLGLASGAVALIGLLTKKDTLILIGAAGALYSADRYEKDRKSQSKMERARAAAVNRGWITHNGKKYVRRTVYKNGKKYYKFVRA